MQTSYDPSKPLKLHLSTNCVLLCMCVFPLWPFWDAGACPGRHLPLSAHALICSGDTWEPSAASSRGGDTLTGRGIRAAWPLTPLFQSVTSLPLGRNSPIQCTHTCKHAQTHTHLATGHQRLIILLPAVTWRRLDKCLSECPKPLLAQAIHLRLSAKADSRPIR